MKKNVDKKFKYRKGSIYLRMLITKKLVFIVTAAIIVSASIVVPTVVIQLNLRNVDDSNGNQITNPINPNDENESAPFVEIITIAGINFTFDNFLWRDFMPICPPGGTDLMAVIHLKAINETNFPIENYTSERMWVFYNDETWTANLQLLEIGDPTQNSITLRADGGPKWGPHVYVNITLEIIYQGCYQYYISAFNQEIWRTD